MGQKINPKSFRVGITENWSSRWFFTIPDASRVRAAPRKWYGTLLKEDEALRNLITKKLAQAGISGIDIERTVSTIRVFIKAARPGFIIGKGGKGIEELSTALEREIQTLRKTKLIPRLSVNIDELKRSEIAAQYVAQQIAWDLEKRFPYRRTMKKYLEQVMQNREAKGAKIFLSGRLDGNEIARRETMKQGPLPLQTLRADIDYGTATAFTGYGTVGIKVWIYKGEKFVNAQNKK